MSGTGISNFRKDVPKMAISFGDLTCPYCGIGTLEITSANLKEENIRVRYHCNKCGFDCPIHHDMENHIVEPIYGDKVTKFLENFDRRDD